MKKVGAVVGAVVMVVAAFAIRGIGDDDDGGDTDGDSGANAGGDTDGDSGDSGDTRGDDSGGGQSESVTEIICPTEFKEMCDEIEGVEVTYELAGDTTDRLLAATGEDNTLDGQAWVIPAAWADLVRDTRRLNDAEILFFKGDAVASTGPALAIHQDREDELDCPRIGWSCLSDAVDGQLTVVTPPVDSALGLPLMGAQLIEVAGTTLLEPNDVQLLPDFQQRRDAFDVLLASHDTVGAAATTLAEADGAVASSDGAPISVIEPPGDARIDLVVITRKDERSDMSIIFGQTLGQGVHDAIAQAFLDANWTEPRFTDDFSPKGDILNLIREAAQ